MIKQDYKTLKDYFDNILNPDKSTYKNSNDEPTPIGCIEEMLDVIPDAAWNENAKILDPCCGNGYFSMYLYFQLLKDQTEIKELKKRHDRVIKQITMIDINSEFYDSLLDFFGSDSIVLRVSPGEATRVVQR